MRRTGLARRPLKTVCDPFVLSTRFRPGKVGLVQKPWRLLCILLVAPYSDTVHVHPPLAHVCCVNRSLLLLN